MSVYKKYLLCPTPAKEVDQEGSFDDKVACKGNRINEQEGILTVIIYLCSPKKIPISNMKKIWILAVLTICSVATQAQEVFINADLVSSYIWRGMKNGNASVQPTLGVEWKGWTLSAWGIDRIQK